MHNLIDFSLLSLISKTDIVIKAVIITLLVMSLISWAVLFEKLFKINTINQKADLFEKRFWSGIMLEEFYDKNKNKLKHPMGEIFSNAMQEWINSDTNKAVNAIELVKTGLRERIESSIEATMLKIEAETNKHIETIGFIASSSPFVGLFGTVWGIMNSFKSIAGSNVVALQVVAPGIAEALFTTATGILIAVFAMLFHHLVSKKSTSTITRMRSFGIELSSILSRELDSFSIKNYNAYQNRNQTQQ